MNSIPTDFEVTTAKSNYTKLTPGKHKLRVLGNAISGWVWWIDQPDGGRRPKRVKEGENIPVSEGGEAKKFLAFPVWNYEQSKVQVWEITQASIQRELKALDSDGDWGDLKDYDLEIERTGNDLNSTRYRVTPKPKSALATDVTKEVKMGLPELEALYIGEDPFTWTIAQETEIVKEDDLPL